jgi:hypothetical protein
MTDTNNSTAPEEKMTVAESIATRPTKKGQAVTSSVTIDFPSLGWSINEGDTKELPDDTDAQAIILACGYITLVK